MLIAHRASQPRFGTGCGVSGDIPPLRFHKKNTKKLYKYEVRRLKRQRGHIVLEKIGVVLSKTQHRDFLKEVHKVFLDGCVSDFALVLYVLVVTHSCIIFYRAQLGVY